jgi:hypothetical protein
MYTEDHAEKLKNRAGEKWQPSNGTEFMMFIDGPCADCIHSDSCMKPSDAQIFDATDKDYPDWVYGTDGLPQCESREINHIKKES